MALPQPTDPLLDGLNTAQREAVLTSSGPLVILAGAGTGKTRVISRRAAYAIATGATIADQVLLVTFSDKAAGEMAERMRALGRPGVTARTFHAHALSQLRWFWPARHGGRTLPRVLESKIPIVGPPGSRACPAATASRPPRISPTRSSGRRAAGVDPRRLRRRGNERPARAADPGGAVRAPLRRLRAGQGAGRARSTSTTCSTLTVELLEADEEAAALVRSRKRWFSVDEYQDTNPLQERLLELWLGERPRPVRRGRRGPDDLHVHRRLGRVPDRRSRSATRARESFALTENYRSTPQVLELANRLIARTGRSKALSATRPAGPPPVDPEVLGR